MAAGLLHKPVDSLIPLPGKFLDSVRRSPIRVSEAGAPSIAEIERTIRSFPGVRLVVLDHIGKVRGGRLENRNLEVGDVARAMKALAKDLDFTALVLCQMNRGIEGRLTTKPRLSDLRESGDIEQEADSVGFLYPAKLQKDVCDGMRRVKLTWEKNRHGEPKTWSLLMSGADHEFTVEALGMTA